MVPKTSGQLIFVQHKHKYSFGLASERAADFGSARSWLTTAGDIQKKQRQSGFGRVSSSFDLSMPFLPILLGNSCLSIHQPSYPFGTLTSFKNQLQLPFFMEIIVTMSWAIWTVRNDTIFRQVQPSITYCKTIFKREFAQVILRAKSSLAPLLTQWLEVYV